MFIWLGTNLFRGLCPSLHSMYIAKLSLTTSGALAAQACHCTLTKSWFRMFIWLATHLKLSNIDAQALATEGLHPLESILLVSHYSCRIKLVLDTFIWWLAIMATGLQLSTVVVQAVAAAAFPSYGTLPALVLPPGAVSYTHLTQPTNREV